MAGKILTGHNVCTHACIHYGCITVYLGIIFCIGSKRMPVKFNLKLHCFFGNSEESKKPLENMVQFALTGKKAVLYLNYNWINQWSNIHIFLETNA